MTWMAPAARHGYGRRHVLPLIQAGVVVIHSRSPLSPSIFQRWPTPPAVRAVSGHIDVAIGIHGQPAACLILASRSHRRMLPTSRVPAASYFRTAMSRSTTLRLMWRHGDAPGHDRVARTVDSQPNHCIVIAVRAIIVPRPCLTAVRCVVLHQGEIRVCARAAVTLPATSTLASSGENAMNAASCPAPIGYAEEERDPLLSPGGVVLDRREVGRDDAYRIAGNVDVAPVSRTSPVALSRWFPEPLYCSPIPEPQSRRCT